MASIDELKAAIEKLETSAVDIESNAREMFRSARLINTSKGGLVPYASYEWIGPTNDASWKRLQRDVIRKYQEWYSTALQYIKVHSSDRLEEFIRFYGDRTGEFNGIIDALHLNIHYWNGDTTKIVDEHMDWFGRQRDVLLSIPSIVEAQEKVTVTPNPVNSVSNLCERFQFVVRQLRANRKGHEPVDIKDEYDVQYLFHALLQLYFDDIRPEEVTPSYAGGSARMDFLLKPEQIAIETKMARRSLDTRELGSQLIEDIGRYQVHPDCKVLICFVYDPEGLIANPKGVENDLNKLGEKLHVQVFIRP